ncbi:anti-sigma factor family protein [Streptomyces prunicolor]|uniref:anti-sigma factor family protein n=1 Tax=Streptomyces prunicolor TaxID=67348 RepID=UPI00039CB8B2|nr:anti-sigma factor [Streptomyces prunicolor]
MSGSRPTPAEQHLGDRLSALVDGELGHESRERVLAHLATCTKCKAEADAQRRLKNVFAEMAPPPPSESFLARLQGLPGGGGDTDGEEPPGGGLFAAGIGVFGVKRDGPLDAFEFGYVPATPHVARALTPSSSSSSRSAREGFRIHDVSRHDADRSASRGMRFAFVAAGAVSLAAIALGGVATVAPGDTAAEARGGTGVTPARTQGAGVAATTDAGRRRAVGPLLAQGTSQRSMLGDTAVPPTSVSAPLLPGVPSPAAVQGDEVLHTLTAPVMAGAAVMSPLIRPVNATAPVALTSWSTAPEVMAPGLLRAPAPDATSSPSSTPSFPAHPLR